MLNSFLTQSFTLISLFFIAVISLVVLRKDYQKTINQVFFFLALILNIFLFGSFMLLSGQDRENNILWDRFIYVGIVFWPALQYHFSLAVTYFNKKRNLILYFSYALSSVFLIFIPSNYFISDYFYYSWGIHGKAQIFHYFFLIYFIIFAILFFQILIKKYRKENKKANKNRLLFYILGFIIINIIGMVGFLPAYSISVFPIYLIGPILFIALIAYSISYFNLMNVKLVMRRYFVYFLSFTTIVVPANIILFIIDSNYYYYTFISSIIIYSIALFIFPPIKKFYYNLSNKYFFSSLYSLNDLVYNLSLSLHSSFEIKTIFKSIITLLSEAFHAKSAAIISYSDEEQKIIINYKQGLSKMREKKININKENLKLFFSNNKASDIKNLKDNLKERTCPFFDYLQKNKIKLVVPVETKVDDYFYFMVFGEKESKEKYIKRDLKVLELASFELGLALENIFLYLNIKKFNVKLKDEIKKATEKLRKQNEELMKLDKMKDEFISVVSHQLRTPLTGIRWSTEVLTKNKSKNLNKKQFELLNQIKTNNLGLIKLVNDLLDLSRIEMGYKLKHPRQKFNFNILVEEVLQDNLFLINSKNIKLVNKVSQSLQIKADRDKLKQVLQNLVINAVKYSFENGEINIYTHLKNNEVFFYIEDNGIGVPKNQQKYLFTKFFRAKNASLQNASGSGLGLYIAKEIIRYHKGKLFFKDNKNGGSIFYFFLPLN